MADSQNNTNLAAATDALRRGDIGELVCIQAALQRIFSAANAAQNEPRCKVNGMRFISDFILGPAQDLHEAVIGELKSRTPKTDYERDAKTDTLARHYLDGEEHEEALKLLADTIASKAKDAA
jgi:hypothetical protein